MENSDSKKNTADVVCLGTKSVDIKNSDSTKKEGLLAIFRTGKIEEEALRVVVADEEGVYQGRIAMKEVKMKLLEGLGDKSKHLDVLAGYLLHKTCPRVQPAYSYQASTNDAQGETNDCIKLVIKYYDSKNIDDQDAAMKKAWDGTLQKETSSTRGNNIMSFYRLLGEGINQGQHNIEKLQGKIENLKKNCASWKDTAEKLEGAWQDEKDTLFQNFVLLYNQTRDALEKTRNELQDLKRRQAEEEQEKRVSKRPRIKREEGEEDLDNLADQPDDIDDRIFGQDMVDALASARPVSLNTNASKYRGTTSRQPPTKRVKVKKEKVDDGQDDRKLSAVGVKTESDSDSEDSVEREVKRLNRQTSHSSDDEEGNRVGTI